MPEILYLKYDDSVALDAFNFRVEYPKIKSPLKVDFVGINGRIVVGKNNRELLGFDLNDISIGKQDPLLIDVGMSIKKLLARGCLNLNNSGTLSLELSCVICARLCRIPLFFRKQFVYQRELFARDEEPIDFAKYADMASVAVRDSRNSPGFTTGNLMGIDLYVDKLKLLKTIRDKFCMVSTAEIEARICSRKFYTDLGFMRTFEFRESSFEEKSERFMQFSVVLDLSDDGLGSWIVDSIRNGYPSITITGMEGKGFKIYSAEEPLFSTEWLFCKNTNKKRNKKPAPPVLAGVCVDQRVEGNSLLVAVSADYDSTFRRIFSIFKFVLPRNNDLKTSIEFNVMERSSCGPAARVSVTIEPFEIKNREVFLRHLPRDGAGDIVSGGESSSYSESTEEVLVNFAKVVVPPSGRELLFTAKISNVLMLRLIRCWRQPYTAVSIRGEWVFRVFNCLNILINEEYGVFLASRSSSAWMIHPGMMVKTRKPKKDEEVAVEDYTVKHEIVNVGDRFKTMKCISILDLPPSAGEADSNSKNVIKIDIPALDLGWQSLRGKVDLDWSATRIFYSALTGKFFGRIHLVSTYHPSEYGLDEPCETKDVLGLFPSATCVYSKLFLDGNALTFGSIANEMREPSGRLFMRSVCDERLEIRKLRMAGVDSQDIDWKYVGMCVSAKLVDLLSDSKTEPRQVVGGKSSPSVFSMVPVHLDLDGINEEMKRGKLRLRSKLVDDLEEFDFKMVFDDFIRQNNIASCPVFCNIKHVITFSSSIHLIVSSPSFASAKRNNPDNIQFTELAVDDQPQHHPDDSALEGGAQVQTKIWDGRRRVIHADIKARIALMRNENTSACGSKGYDEEYFKNLFCDDSVSGVVEYPPGTARDRMLLPDLKYTNGKEVPFFNEFILETPADSGLVSITIVKPTIVVSSLDSLYFLYLPDSVDVYAGVNNLEYFGYLLDGKVQCRTFNKNDVISTLASLLLNGFVFGLSACKEKEETERPVGSHIHAKSSVAFKTMGDVESGDACLSVVMPSMLLRLSEYLVVDFLDDLEFRCSFLGDSNGSAFSARVSLERQNVQPDDLTSFAEIPETDLLAIFERSIDKAEKLRVFLEYQNLVADFESGEGFTANRNEAPQQFNVPGSLVSFLSSLDHYKKFVVEASVAFNRQASAGACLLSLSSFNDTILRSYVSRDACFAFLDKLFFYEDSLLSRLVGNGLIRSILNSKFVAKKEFVNREFLKSFVNSVGDLPLLGLDIKEMKKVKDNDILVGIDVVSDDFHSWVERNIALCLQKIPGSSALPRHVLLELDVQAEELLSIKFAGQRVFGFSSPEAFMQEMYEMKYCKKTKNLEEAWECADVERNRRRMEIMRALVQGVGMNGTFNHPIDAHGDDLYNSDSEKLVDFVIKKNKENRYLVGEEEEVKSGAEDVGGASKGDTTSGAVGSEASKGEVAVNGTSKGDATSEATAGDNNKDDTADETTDGGANAAADEANNGATANAAIDEANKGDATGEAAAGDNNKGDAAGDANKGGDTASVNNKDDTASDTIASEANKGDTTGEASKDDNAAPANNNNNSNGKRSIIGRYSSILSRLDLVNDFASFGHITANLRTFLTGIASGCFKDSSVPKNLNEVRDGLWGKMSYAVDLFKSVMPGFAVSESVPSLPSVGKEEEQSSDKKDDDHPKEPAEIPPSTLRLRAITEYLKASNVVLPAEVAKQFKNISNWKESIFQFDYCDERWLLSEFLAMYSLQRELLRKTIGSSKVDTSTEQFTDKRPISVTFLVSADISKFMQVVQGLPMVVDEEKLSTAAAVLFSKEHEEMCTEPIDDEKCDEVVEKKDEPEKESSMEDKEAEDEVLLMIRRLLYLNAKNFNSAAKLPSSLIDTEIDLSKMSILDLGTDLSKCREQFALFGSVDSCKFNLTLFVVNFLTSFYRLLLDPGNKRSNLEDLLCFLGDKILFRGGQPSDQNNTSEPSSEFNNRIIFLCIKYILASTKVIDWSIVIKNVLRGEENSKALLALAYNLIVLLTTLEKVHPFISELFKVFSPRVDFLLCGWIHYLYSSTKPKHALVLPFVLRFVGQSSLCLDLRLPVRLYLLNQKSLSLSLLMGGRLFFTTRLVGSLTSSRSSSNGFSTTIPIAYFQAPLSADQEVFEPTKIKDDVWKIQSIKLSNNDYSLLMLTHLARRDTLRIAHGLIIAGTRIAVAIVPIFHALGLSSLWFRSYREFSIKKYYALDFNSGKTFDPIKMVVNVNGLFFFDKEELAIYEYDSIVPATTISQIYKIYPEAFTESSGLLSSLRAARLSVCWNFINGRIYALYKKPFDWFFCNVIPSAFGYCSSVYCNTVSAAKGALYRGVEYLCSVGSECIKNLPFISKYFPCVT